jgi:F-type H+-transporting ATPase subunit b
MLIDWFTVVAQVVNFLILVWLLKRFLYRPIIDAIDAREQRIASELAAADARMTEANQARDAFREKNAAFDQQRATLLSQATTEAKAERVRLLDEARLAADALRVRQQDVRRSEAQSLNQVIRSRAQAEVFAIARKTLADLAGASLEDRMVEVFIRRLQDLDTQSHASLAAALASASDPARVRSAFDLSAAQQTTLRQALDASFSQAVPLRFETAPDVVGGIELSANGQKLAWSIADYLQTLEKSVDELLKGKTVPAPAIVNHGR